MIVAEGEVTHAVEAGLEAEVVEGKISDFLFFVANYSSIRPLLLFGHLTRPRLCMIFTNKYAAGKTNTWEYIQQA